VRLFTRYCSSVRLFVRRQTTRTRSYVRSLTSLVVTAPKPQTKYDLRHNRWYGKGMSYVIKKISRKTQKIAVDKYVRQWNVQK